MNQKNKIEGVVRKIYQDQKRFGFYINPTEEGSPFKDVRFSGFGKCDFREGDYVSFEAVLKRVGTAEYWNIVSNSWTIYTNREEIRKRKESFQVPLGSGQLSEHVYFSCPHCATRLQVDIKQA